MLGNGDDGVLLVRLGAVVTQTVLYITPAKKEERRNPTMYKILKSTDQGLDELELEHLEKGYWLDIVAPSVEELQEIAAATKIQMDFLSAALDEEEKSRIEVEDDQILILVDIPFLRSNKDYDTLPLGIVVTEEGIATICLEPNAVTADFGTHNSKMFSTFKKTRFLFQILYKSATLYLKYIRIIIRRTDELEIHLRQSMENSEICAVIPLYWKDCCGCVMRHSPSIL